MSVWRQQGVEKLEFLRVETVVECTGGSTDAPVPSIRWQENEESMGWV